VRQASDTADRKYLRFLDGTSPDLPAIPYLGKEMVISLFRRLLDRTLWMSEAAGSLSSGVARIRER
jgi:hypothetical protein